MKILADQEKMSSAEIRKILNVSWGEYRPHIKSLEERGFIEINNEFNEDGHVIQILQILEIGRKEYTIVFDLLVKFTSPESPFNNIIHNKSYHETFGDDLYPIE